MERRIVPPVPTIPFRGHYLNEPPLIHGGRQMFWTAAVVVSAVVVVGLVALFHLLFLAPMEAPGVTLIDPVGGLVLWMRCGHNTKGKTCLENA